MVDLSIIIVSFNTAQMTINCIESIIKSFGQGSKVVFEIIVVDNASTDGTIQEIQNYSAKLKIIENKENLGFAKANNQAVKQAEGKYLLFLNSDVIVKDVNFNRLIELLDEDSQIGVLTVKVIRSDGEIDPACHRGFPTLWRSFCYFSKLEKLFGQWPILDRVFGGYHLVYFDKNIIHEIDSPSGAFYLTRKNLFDQITGFDEKFFMYGEDLDLSYRIKTQGFKVIFYPLDQVIHLKYQSGLAGKDVNYQKQIRKYFYQAMALFYKKYYSQKYPKLLNSLVYFLINYEKNRY